MRLGKYKVQEWDENKEEFFDQTSYSLGMHVQVLDPEGKAQLSRVICRFILAVQKLPSTTNQQI